MLPVLRNNGLLPNMAHGPVNRLASLFDQFFNDDFFAPRSWGGLPMALWEDEQNVYAEIDLPGLTEKDIEVSVHNGDLVLRGERKSERKEGGYDARSYGRFEQRVALPVAVDGERIEARLSRGVLCLTCPKSEEARPRKIAIRSE